MKFIIVAAIFGFSAAALAQTRDGNARIISLDSDVKEDSFRYNYETENGIKAEEQGREADGIEAQGGFQYTGDDGQVYSISYAAGQAGYQPQGAHLPTSPPIPEEILKALAQNAADEAAGIVDDGQYNPAKYGGGQGQAQAQQGFGQQQQYRASASSSFGRKPIYG